MNDNLILSRMAARCLKISAEAALPGRQEPIDVPKLHTVLKTPLSPPFPEGMQSVVFAMGCFWGAERLFWQIEGVCTTAAGYVAGYTENPSYEEVCSGKTGHTEAVLVVYDRDKVSLERLLALYWQSHDPTQGMRQGNDIGSQYRSGVYWCSEKQKAIILASAKQYQYALKGASLGEITSELAKLETFYYAESYHQQYLAKNPNGYCGLAGLGVSLDH